MTSCAVDYDGNPVQDEITKQLFHLLWLRFNKCVVGYSDQLIEDGEQIDEIKTDDLLIANKINYVYLTTFDKYSVMFKLYEDNKGKLMDQVKSISINRFNDTPQNGGDFSNDDHTSSINKSETSNDYGPIMDRVASIEYKYHKLMQKWVDEFKTILGGGEQIYV